MELKEEVKGRESLGRNRRKEPKKAFAD